MQVLIFLSAHLSLLPVFLFFVTLGKKNLGLRINIVLLSSCSFIIDLLSSYKIANKESNHVLLGIYDICSSFLFALLIFQIMKGMKYVVPVLLVNGSMVLLIIYDAFKTGLINQIHSGYNGLFSFLILLECLVILNQNFPDIKQNNIWISPKFLLTMALLIYFSLTFVITSILGQLSQWEPEKNSFNDIFWSIQLSANSIQHLLFSAAIWTTSKKYQ
jgi:hypothetical protein